MIKYVTSAAILSCLTGSVPCLAAKAAATNHKSPLAIVGKWHRPCYASQYFKGEYSDENIEFAADGTFHRDVHRYGASTCFTSSLEENQAMDGTYSVGAAEAKIASDVHQLDLKVDALYSTAIGEEAMRSFNQSSYCNVSDWQRDVKRSVMGFPCFGRTLDAGAKIFDVVSVRGPELFLGKKSFIDDGSLASVRPHLLNTALPFQREPAVSH